MKFCINKKRTYIRTDASSVKGQVDSFVGTRLVRCRQFANLESLELNIKILIMDTKAPFCLFFNLSFPVGAGAPLCRSFGLR